MIRLPIGIGITGRLPREAPDLCARRQQRFAVNRLRNEVRARNWPSL